MDVFTHTIPYTNEPEVTIIETPVEEVIIDTVPPVDVPMFEKPSK
jgi:hypothetical protein